MGSGPRAVLGLRVLGSVNGRKACASKQRAFESEGWPNPKTSVIVCV